MPSINQTRAHGPFTPTQSVHNHLQERASSYKARILGVSEYIKNSWIESVQKKAFPSEKSTPSIFEREKALVESLFGGVDDPDKAKIYGFYKALKSFAKSSITVRESLQIQPVDEFKEQIAQIVYLAERDPSAVAALLDPSDIGNSLKLVQKSFDNELEKLLTSINERCEQHQQVALQDATFVSSGLKSKAIAMLLSSSADYLNLGLIGPIKRGFFDATKPLLQYEKDLIQTLDVLDRSPDLQEQLTNISKPADPSLISNDLIRISLGLPNDADVTDKQARLVALTALLGDMRQGDVGSCFATSISIMMMGALKEKVVSDFTEILEQGKLTRKSATDQSEFIPYLDIGDGSIHKAFEVDSKGGIDHAQGFIWDSPGIINACRQLGIEAYAADGLIEQTIAKEFIKQGLGSGEKLEITVEWLVGKLVDEKFGTLLTPLQKDDISSLALVAFCSETNNPLLRAWESCLASMAEASGSNMVRGRIIDCAALPLTGVLPKSAFTNRITTTAKKVQDIFKNAINSGIQLRYDEQVAVEAQKTGGDGHSTSLGAFVLHEVRQGERSTSAKKVSNPEEFRAFVLDRLKATEEVVNSLKATSAEAVEYRTTLEKIRQFIAKPGTGSASYLYNALRSYDEESNASLAFDLKNWEQLEHLPFRDATGNDNRAVFAKATGFDTNNSTSIRPRNAQELLERFIAFGKQRAREDGFLTDDDPYQRYMVDTPQHAFTLTPEDASVVGAMKESVNTSNWIRANIIRPGKTVSNLTLTSEQKSAYADQVESRMIPKELKSIYRRGVKKISSKSSTVNAYSNELIKVIQAVTGRKDDAATNSFANGLTSILISSVLPPAARRILSNTAARIADTNWVDEGVKHIYFACFFNPVTNTIELGSINEDGQGLFPQDQEEWVTYVPWEMYGVKLEPTLSKKKVNQIVLEKHCCNV